MRLDARCLHHGSLEQRTRWFITGLTSGKVESCDTFNAAQLWTGNSAQILRADLNVITWQSQTSDRRIT